MLTFISVILIAWYVEMPLWLSILITVLVGVHVVYVFVDSVIKSWTKKQVKELEEAKKSLLRKEWEDDDK